MKINADFAEAVALRTNEIDWSASPMAGVERRMLDRIGGEVARATSIVRYAPGSHFSAHTHSGGEEFIVLDGVFQDEHGDYPAGTYIRNPMGTRHIPRADDGCTIFVKLWQFAPDDTEQFALDLNSLPLERSAAHAGIAQAVLHSAQYEHVALQQWNANTARSFADVAGAELLILSGSIAFRGEEFARNDWIRLPPHSSEALVSGNEGARVWLKTGHLGMIAREGWEEPQDA